MDDRFRRPLDVSQQRYVQFKNTEDSSSPIICNSPLRTDDSQHRLSVPLSVSDLQLDGHMAAGGWCCHWSVKQEVCLIWLCFLYLQPSA